VPQKNPWGKTGSAGSENGWEVPEAGTGDLDDLPQAENKEGSVMTPAAPRADCKNFRRLQGTRTGFPGKSTIPLVMLNEFFVFCPVAALARILAEISQEPRCTPGDTEEELIIGD
jgi:hypothetical protein